ncbi:MAG: InlB B-repeat-containing protein [bacterium]|nr:InlB B-repeat-containing protein [bacterium]
MLKGIKRIFLLIMLLIPFMVIADENYQTSIKYANSYIDAFSEYQNYILFPKSGYYYNETLKTDIFTRGGFLSRKEYLITNYKNKSYLSPGVQYWTLTPGLSDNSKRYVIDFTDKEILTNYTSGVRVTEFILPKTRVEGEGTRSNPWVFSSVYKVVLSTSNYKKGLISSQVGGNCNNKGQSLVTSIYEDESIDVQLCPVSGYEYYSTDCGSNVSKVEGKQHMISVSNVKKNTSCKINFIVTVYKISLDTNGGSEIDTKELYLAPNRYWFKEKDDRITETQITKIDKLPTKTGYTFNGFYLDKTSEIKLIDEAGNLISTSGYTTDGTMYARYTANKYQVTLNQQLGTGGTPSVTVTYDSEMPTITKLPTREGYTFSGYYTSTNGSGTKYYNADGTSAKKWNIASDTTLYAYWTPNKLDIVFNANGATIKNEVELEGIKYYWKLNTNGNIMRSKDKNTYTESFYSKKYTDNIDLPNYNYSNYIKLTKTGYTALSTKEWCTNTDGSGNCFNQAAIYSAKDICPTIVSGDCNIKLYTNWTANKYTITFDKQFGSGGTTIIAATYNSAMPTITLPTRTGYKFAGYYTEKGGVGTKYYNADGTSANKWNITSDTTLYAYWIPNKLNIVFNANGATIKNEVELDGTKYYWKLSTNGNIMRSKDKNTYTESFYSKKYTDNIDLPNYNYSDYIKLTKTGYTALSGKEWCTNPDGSGKCFNQAVTSYSAKDICPTIVSGDCNITLYTNWKKDKIACATTSDLNAVIQCNTTDKSKTINYTGKCSYECESADNFKIKFLTSGTLTLNSSLNIDAFLVGGGGGASSADDGCGGGGGYTKTIKNLTISGTNVITVGAAGIVNGNGGNSTAFGYTAAGGYAGRANKGGNGGSGGSCQCGIGGSYGNIGKSINCDTGGNISSYYSGRGQISTSGPNGETGNTCEFGEGTASGCTRGTNYAYSGGGGSGITPFCSNGVGCKSYGGGSQCGINGRNGNPFFGLDDCIPPIENTGGGGGSSWNGGTITKGATGIVIIRNKR